MDEPPSNAARPGRIAGFCAGGFFAAAAVYLANTLAMVAGRDESLPAVAMLAAVTLTCTAAGILVLAEKPWMGKGAVLVAGSFAMIHLVGVIFLLFDPSGTTPPLACSLQWQLGTTFLVLWVGVLVTAWFNLRRRT